MWMRTGYHSSMVPTLSDIRAAAARIAGTVGPTPLVYSHWLSEIAKGDVWLKLELMQPTGSYKIRGAVNALARLKETNPAATTVVTASAGNHGQAIALAASQTGVQARVHLPASAPETKRQGMKRLGTEVVDAGSYDDAELLGRKDAATSSASRSGCAANISSAIVPAPAMTSASLYGET